MGDKLTEAHTAAYRTVVSCSNCGNDDPDIIEDFTAGDLICADCGLVLGDRVIDMRSEWRTFSNDNSGAKDQSRVGDASDSILSDEAQLSTMISKVPGGTVGEGGSKWQTRSLMATSDKALLAAVKAINSMAERIGLPLTIRNKAAHLFKEVEGHKIIKTRNPEGVNAACVYIACRQEGVPRTLREISALTDGCSKKEIGKSSKAILQILGPAVNVNVVSSGDFMTRFCSNLRLPIEIERLAKHISEESKRLGLSGGKSPISIAGTAIFMASQLNGSHRKTMKEISDVVGVSESTIRLTYRSLYQYVDKLFTAEFLKNKSLSDLPSL